MALQHLSPRPQTWGWLLLLLLVAVLAGVSLPLRVHAAPSARGTAQRVALAGTTTPPPAPPGQSAQRCQRNACARLAVSLLNQVRATYHRPPLRLNLTLSNGTGSCPGAYGHSVAMARTQSLWQVNRRYPRASFPAEICTQNYTVAGENVGVWVSGSEIKDLRMLNAHFMHFPHDAATCRATGATPACNVINGHFRQVGIGVYFKSGVTWLTEDFIG